MQTDLVCIDSGKTTFHLVALGAAGVVIVLKKFNQKQFPAYTANVPASSPAGRLDGDERSS